MVGEPGGAEQSMIDYRPAVASDERLIVDSWSSALKYSHTAGLISLRDWSDVMRPQIAKVLARPLCRVWVAYDPQETDTRFDLYGWIAVERGYSEMVSRRVRGRREEFLQEATRPLVHFVFVKRSFRGEGIARGLFKAADVDPDVPLNYTCKTATAARLVKKFPAAEWKPLIARHPPT